MTMRAYIYNIIAACSLLLTSCIDPPLHLAGQQLLAEIPQVQTDLSVVWDIETDWTVEWYYGWEMEDIVRWGAIGYSTPKSYQVRRYFKGESQASYHPEVDPPFSINGNSFRRYFSFGYYDILIWSDIDSPDGTQVLVINESPNSVTATTTGVRGLSRSVSKLIGNAEETDNETSVIGMKNQPELFYAAYPENVYISRSLDDYVYDPTENIYIKKIETQLRPLVYIYLVQIVLLNNDGRIKGINGNSAISSMASGTDLYTGHTNNIPSVIYFDTHLKRNQTVDGQLCDIIGGKLTTFGLCDMEPYTRSGSRYTGSRNELNNYLFFDLLFSNGGVKTYSYDVTEQCQSQAHGGVITVYIDCNQLIPPDNSAEGEGSLFVPSVEDYEEVYWEIPF